MHVTLNVKHLWIQMLSHIFASRRELFWLIQITSNKSGTAWLRPAAQIFWSLKWMQCFCFCCDLNRLFLRLGLVIALWIWSFSKYSLLRSWKADSLLFVGLAVRLLILAVLGIFLDLTVSASASQTNNVTVFSGLKGAPQYKPHRSITI